MAPLSIIAHTVSEIMIERRGLGSTFDKDSRRLKESHENILECLALVFSTFSVASAVLTFYWFMKMRRSFRHDLVMMLIQSDMFKSFWLMTYPIISFVNGRVKSSSKICQVNGFFLAVGIEASDISVLMIAIHSALYIFKPRASSGKGGLYPYRRIVYSIWIIYPLLMASLAFTHEGAAYVSNGTFCYLPVRPFWYRLALAWIPRYIIFMTILGIYASIYLYVRSKFRGFTELGQTRSEGSTEDSQVQDWPPKGSLPQTPPLVLNGLIPGSQQNSAVQFVSRPETIQSSPRSTRSGAHRFIWANLISVSPPSPTKHNDTTPDLMVVDKTFSASSTTFQPLSPMTAITLPSAPPSVFSSAANTPSRPRISTWHDPYLARPSPTPGSAATAQSVVDIFTVLENKPGQPQVLTPISQLRLTNSRGENLAVAEMLGARDKIRRQLRYLFIYPLVYIGMWLIPFISHILQYRDKFTKNPPFILLCLTTIFLASQAAVDCWVFSTREKPWRHIPGNSKSFLGSLKFWSGWKGASKKRAPNGPGKTRDEMFREAQVAYHRRDEEMAQRRIEGVNLGANGDAKKEKSWWDASGLDPNITPLLDEVTNPLDTVIIEETRPTQDPNALRINIMPETAQAETESPKTAEHGIK